MSATRSRNSRPRAFDTYNTKIIPSPVPNTYTPLIASASSPHHRPPLPTTFCLLPYPSCPARPCYNKKRYVSCWVGRGRIIAPSQRYATLLSGATNKALISLLPPAAHFRSILQHNTTHTLSSRPFIYALSLHPHNSTPHPPWPSSESTKNSPISAGKFVFFLDQTLWFARTTA